MTDPRREQLIDELKREGITDAAVLAAIAQTPREDFVDEPLYYVTFVVQRKLDGDRGQLLEASGRLDYGLLPMLEVGADHIIPVKAVYRKDSQDREIGDEQSPIEPAQLVDIAKRSIGQRLCKSAQRSIRQQCDRK